MQIISDQVHASNFIHNLRECLGKESFSWEGWHLLHVMPKEPLEGYGESDLPYDVAKLLRLLLPDSDGVILLGRDGSLLVLVQQGEEGDPFAELIEGLNHSTDIRVPSLNLLTFNVKNDRWAIQALLELFGGEIYNALQPSQEAPEMLYNLAPHLGNFMSAWTYLTQGRKGREMPHLLIVDDDPIARRIVRTALGERYPVVTAANAAEAVEKHLLLVPDIVFLDIGLPDCDGFRILDHIRACDHECEVIMFSSNSFLDNRLKALSHGATGFLPKPFNRHQFESYIEDWMREHRAA